MSGTNKNTSQENEKMSGRKAENESAIPEDKSFKEERIFPETNSQFLASQASSKYETRNNPVQKNSEKRRKEYRDENTQKSRKALREKHFRKLDKTKVLKPSCEVPDRVMTVQTSHGPKGVEKMADNDISSRLIQSVLRKLNDTSIARDEPGLVSAQHRRKATNKQKHALDRQQNPGVERSIKKCC